MSNTRFSESKRLPGTTEPVLQSAADVLSDRDARNVEVAADRVTASTHWSWLSWGENVHVTTSEDGEGWVVVTATSVSRYGGAVTDRFKNKKNVEAVLTGIQTN
jgi:hypothetical protein